MYAVCTGIANSCVDAQHIELALVQLRASEIPVQQFAELEVRCECGLPQRELYWMHTPKTGTSFKWTIQEVMPNDGYRLGAFHEPLPVDASDTLLSAMTTMLRDPAQRLASAIAYTRTCRFPQIGWKFTNHHGCGAEEVFKLANEGKSPANDDCLASLTGCQTNMLTGKGCMTGGSHNKSDIEIAKSRLDKFFFVGVVEEWELAICLFNFKLTGKRYFEDCQVRDSRPTDPSHPNDHTYDVAGYPTDEADEEIYRHGKERFHMELAQHGITKEACAPSLELAIEE